MEASITDSSSGCIDCRWSLVSLLRSAAVGAGVALGGWLRRASLGGEKQRCASGLDVGKEIFGC